MVDKQAEEFSARIFDITHARMKESIGELGANVGTQAVFNCLPDIDKRLEKLDLEDLLVVASYLSASFINGFNARRVINEKV